MSRFLPLALAFLVAATPAAAETIAFIHAHLIPVAGDEIPDGTLVVEDGWIKAVGPSADVTYPGSATVIDMTGRTIMPGLVDTHSHIGGFQAADRSSPIQPGVRILDAVNVFASGYRRAVAGGLTTLNVMPGSGWLSSGQTIYLKMRGIADGAVRPEDLAYLTADGRIVGGLKMANGTNSMREPPFPGTRGKSAYLVRQKFIAAREYQELLDAAGDDATKRPPRDLDLESLAEVLRGERVVHYHTHRADDVMTILRLKEEFGFEVVLHHVSEGWKVAEAVAAADIPCSIITVDSPGGKHEAVELRYETGAVMAAAGVLIAYHTDDWITDSRLFLRSPAFGVRGGLDRETALASVTINGAKMLGLDDRIGSLEPAKDADFVVLDGDPLSVWTRVLETWVEGHKVFDRSDPEDHFHAVGGMGASRDAVPFLCCADQGGES